MRQREEIAELKSFRPKSERMEPINRAVRKARPRDPSKVKEEAARKRHENRRAQERLPQGICPTNSVLAASAIDATLGH